MLESLHFIRRTRQLSRTNKSSELSFYIQLCIDKVHVKQAQFSKHSRTNLSVIFFWLKIESGLEQIITDSNEKRWVLIAEGFFN